MRNKKNKSLFLEAFGDTPQLRVLDFLIDNHFFDYPITEIARGSNVSYNSIKLFFPNFIENAIIIKTRKIGKSDYFKLNINNPFIAKLIQLGWNLVRNRLSLANKKEIEILN
ncbi:hypothetical protein HYX16_00220 [Candidatus Woesearchaeota archaeon]|nr:hypothetical protein [Candidatus Woesearchaeota archaeon]